MWIITDNNNVIIDKADVEANLSRGYRLAIVSVGNDVALAASGYKKHSTEVKNIRVRDSFDGSNVIINVIYRKERELEGLKAYRKKVVNQEIDDDIENIDARIAALEAAIVS